MKKLWNWGANYLLVALSDVFHLYWLIAFSVWYWIRSVGIIRTEFEFWCQLYNYVCSFIVVIYCRLIWRYFRWNSVDNLRNLNWLVARSIYPDSELDGFLACDFAVRCHDLQLWRDSIDKDTGIFIRIWKLTVLRWNFRQLLCYDTLLVP